MTKTQPGSLVEPLFHISEEPSIVRFDPRPPPSASSGQTGLMVWAVGERLLHNYLLPRDCPRVTFYAAPTSAPEDVARLLGASSAIYVMAIESRWLPAVRSGVLYKYALPPQAFAPVDEGAGYYIAREPVVPLTVTPIDDILGALLARDVELRVMPSLWQLHDAVVASTLHFSIIRMRNAQPRA
jgi:hypothetical protein